MTDSRNSSYDEQTNASCDQNESETNRNKNPKSQTTTSIKPYLKRKYPFSSSEMDERLSYIIDSITTKSESGDQLKYILHTKDSCLTIGNCFRLCSLYGHIIINGYQLEPRKFYSIYNCRTNMPLKIELKPTISVSDHLNYQLKLQHSKSYLETLIQEDKDDLRQRINKILKEIFRDKKTDDIIIIKKIKMTPFLLTIKDHGYYNKFFFNRNIDVDEEEEEHNLSWNTMENSLNIKILDNNIDQSITISNEFKETVDTLIEQWNKNATENQPYVVMVCGEKDVGKSSFERYLLNRSFDHLKSSLDSNSLSITYFDCDIGQCEFTISGCLSYLDLTADEIPIVGPPCTHLCLKPKRTYYYGLLSPQSDSIRYLNYIKLLKQSWILDHNNQQEEQKQKKYMIIINTMGWGTGLGLELLKETIDLTQPHVIIQIEKQQQQYGYKQDTMPDITPTWYQNQTAYLPFRRKMNMDEKLLHTKFDYVKLQSGVKKTQNRQESFTLRPRDHRLLATWSYFSYLETENVSLLKRKWSDYKCFHLQWNNVVNILIDQNSNQTSKTYNQNSNIVPDCLEHTVVALCKNTVIDKLKELAVKVNDTYHLWSYKDKDFECLGFGWILNCNKESNCYEINTPIDEKTFEQINCIVSGTIDTPEEFSTTMMK